MREKACDDGRPKPPSRRLSEVGNVPQSEQRPQDPAGGSCFQNARGQRPKIADEDF